MFFKIRQFYAKSKIFAQLTLALKKYGHVSLYIPLLRSNINIGMQNHHFQGRKHLANTNFVERTRLNFPLRHFAPGSALVSFWI